MPAPHPLSATRHLAMLLLALLLLAASTQASAAGAAMLAAASGGGDSSEQAVAIPADLTVEEREALLARLSDEQVRELMLQTLLRDAPSNTAGQEQGLLGNLEARSAIITKNLGAMFAAAPQVPAMVPFFFDRLIPEGKGFGMLVLIILGIAGIFAAGMAAEWLVRRLTRATAERLAAANPQTYSGRLGYVALRLLVDLFALAAFMGATIATFFLLYRGYPPVRLTVFALITGVMMVRLVSLTCRFVFASKRPELRIVPLADSDATAIHKGLIRLTIFASAAFLFGFLQMDLGFEEAMGSKAPGNLYMVAMWTVFCALLATGIWKHRQPIAGLIRGSWNPESMEGRIRGWVSGVWHIIGIILVLSVWLIAILSAMLGQQGVLAAALGSLLLLVAVPLADALIYNLVCERSRQRAAALSEATTTADTGTADETDAAVANTGTEAATSARGYETVIIRIARISLTLVGAVLLASLWGVNIFELSTTGVGSKLTGTIIHIGVTIMLAYLAWEVIKRMIERQLGPDDDAHAGPGGEGGEGGGTGASRIKTLLPLVRKFLFITLVTMTGMVVLSSLGIDIGPLMAGAGMLGLAVGFGAQTLVKDVLSGMFFLMDDAFRVGEYIDIGLVKGTVEKISVRSLQMRHHNGPVHTVPYGEIQYCTNFSRDWAIMKFELRIPFETDVDMVRRLIKKVGIEMAADEELGALLLEPMKSQGVNRMDDSAFIVRCKFTSIPGQQFYLRREAYARIQAKFEEKGIKFAPKRVIVETASAGGEAAPALTAAVAGAAAAAAAEEPAQGAAADDRG